MQPLGPYDAPTGPAPDEEDLTNPYSAQVPPDDLSNPYTAGLGIFEQYQPAEWKVRGFRIRFPVISIEEDGQNRIARHPRLYRNKERLDSTGGNSRVWVIISEFYNNSADSRAPGVYPDDLNTVIESFEVQDVGELTVPTIGPVRARFASYKRIEQNGERDFAALTMTFIEDAPDDESASRWQAPSASSVASSFAADAFGSLNDLGLDGDPFGDLSDFADQLQELANAPQEYAQALESKLVQAVSDLKRINDTLTGAVEAPIEIVKMFTSGADTRPQRRLARLTNLIGGARASIQPARVTTKTFGAQTTIFDVARITRQSVTALLQLNSSLPNTLAIPAGTPVRCFGP